MTDIIKLNLNRTSVNPNMWPMLFPSVTPVSLSSDQAREAAAQHLDALAFGWRETTPFTERADAASALQPTSAQARSLAAFLLAAALAAMLVAADKLIDTWTSDHLLVAWVALWSVAFVGLAVLARPMRQLSVRLSNAWMVWLKAQQLKRQDEQMWADACLDPRLMADIQAAQTRAGKA